MSVRSRGLFFEDFAENDIFRTAGRTITEADITGFAGISGDYNPLHTDIEFARRSDYGQRIAHGFLGLSVISGLADRMGFTEGTALALRGVDWKFLKPVAIGDTIRAVFKVVDKREIKHSPGGLIKFKVRVINQHQDQVQRGSWTMLIKNSGLQE